MYSDGAKSDRCPTKVEEEATKRNTDCVYFLASPLTCKKGIECEYRHSEGARVNPRDCRFWLTGNCLNPKCLFRHPPLDGLFGNSGATPGPAVTAYQVTPSPLLPKGNSSAYDLSRNHIPCYYFQKGACLKGDKCSFMHGAQPAGNPITDQTSKYSASTTSQLEISQKNTLNIRECNNQKNLSTSQDISKENADKPTSEPISAAKGYALLENSNHRSSSQVLPHRTGFPRSHIASVPFKASTSFPQHQDAFVQPEWQQLHGEAGEILELSSEVGFTEMRRLPDHQLRPFGDRSQNGKRVEEVLRESSPGFDVLVDDYLHDNDGFNIGSIQDGRNIELEDGYEQHHSGYESCVRLDGDHHKGNGEYQHLGKQQNRDDWVQHSTSSASERVLEKAEFSDKRWARRNRSSEEIGDSDLRHRLMKQRRLNVSTIRSESHFESNGSDDSYNRDRHRTHKSFRDRRRSPENGTISSRLKGRITFPRSSSPEKPAGLREVRDRGGHDVNLSTGVPSRHQGRLGGRLSMGSNENHANARKSGNQQKTGDIADPLDFAGPRSLAELKGTKADGSFPGQPTSNIDSADSLEHNGIKFSGVLPDFDVSVSFESPKPLSILLKKKMESGSKDGAILDISSNMKEAKDDIKVGSTNSDPAPVSEIQPGDAQSNEGFDKLNESSFETVEEDSKGLIHAEDNHINLEQQVAVDATGDAVEADHPEDSDQRYGDFDNHEAEGGGNYKGEDDVDQMDVDIDENEEEDDFAKRIGLIFSGSNQQGR